MSRLLYWLDNYSETHRNPRNKLIHYVCVPVIFINVFALLNLLPLSEGWTFFQPTAAWILLVIGLAFYFRVSFIYGVLMGLISIAILSLCNIVQRGNEGLFFTVNAVSFVLAWIGQFVGHKIEGAKPAFFQDLVFLLVGPLWILDKVMGLSKNDRERNPSEEESRTGLRP